MKRYGTPDPDAEEVHAPLEQNDIPELASYASASPETLQKAREAYEMYKSAPATLQSQQTCQSFIKAQLTAETE